MSPAGSGTSSGADAAVSEWVSGTSDIGQAPPPVELAVDLLLGSPVGGAQVGFGEAELRGGRAHRAEPAHRDEGLGLPRVEAEPAAEGLERALLVLAHRAVAAAHER